jgi:hypothetical protein
MNNIDLFDNTPPSDDEQKEPTTPEKKKKAGVAVWEYKNSDEDFERLIVISLQGLQDQIDAGTLTKEDLPKILYGMEGAINVLKSVYNLYPKSPEFENKKPNDFNGFDDKDSSESSDKLTPVNHT